MIHSIIIDDEQHCIRALLNDLQKNCPSVEIIEACNSAKEGMLAIKRHNPDLIFLDVEMPWMNGFEMLQQLPSIPFDVIFTTGYSAYAIKIPAVNTSLNSKIRSIAFVGRFPLQQCGVVLQ